MENSHVSLDIFFPKAIKTKSDATIVSCQVAATTHPGEVAAEKQRRA